MLIYRFIVWLLYTPADEMKTEKSMFWETDAMLKSLENGLPKGADPAIFVIDMAIKLEKSAKEHFLDLAKRASSKSAKAVFRYVANEEGEHLKALQAQEIALKKDKRWLDKNIKPKAGKCPLAAPAKEEIKFIDNLVPKGQKFGKPPSDLEALGMAVEFKKKAMRFYCASAGTISDRSGKAMLQYLSELEARHLNELEVQYVWLDQAGFWYDPSMMTD